jgi:hypothetical protein
VSDRIDNLLLEPSTVGWKVRHVLSQLRRPNDNADFRQLTFGCVLIEPLQSKVGVSTPAKFGVLARFLVLDEIGERIVLEVVGILVKLPIDTCLLPVLRDSFPRERKAIDVWLFAP